MIERKHQSLNNLSLIKFIIAAAVTIFILPIIVAVTNCNFLEVYLGSFGGFLCSLFSNNLLHGLLTVLANLILDALPLILLALFVSLLRDDAAYEAHSTKLINGKKLLKLISAVPISLITSSIVKEKNPYIHPK